eukprot:Em0007g1285a
MFWNSLHFKMLKDGSIRVCGDYKLTVNRVSSVDAYPLPRVDNLLASTTNAKIFTKLDLSNAYLQLELDEDSQKQVTISTHKGLYKYNPLPIGVSSAPSIFLEGIVAGFPNVVVYIDDILVVGSSEEDHLRTLDIVLKQLEDVGLRLKLAKCAFMMDRVEYLGHLISGDGIQPTEDKKRAILEAPTPQNLQQLRSFLGLLNYYGKFLPNLASILSPLYSLQKKKARWHWGREQEEAFSKAKYLLTSAKVLVPYDPNRKLILPCDASPNGIGAVLSHQFEDGSECPITYASRTLAPAEKKYCQLEKERIQRWALTLSVYSYTMEFKAGKLQSNADALSRLPLQNSEGDAGNTVLLLETLDQSDSVVSVSSIRNWTNKDPVLARPWSRLHVDFAGHFQGKTFIVLVDAHSKWPEVATIPSTSSKQAIKFLRHTFATHGLLEMLVSDNGRAFTSKEFQTFTSRNGIRHMKCSAYHPSTNGLAERTVQTLKEALKKTTGDMETRLARFLFQCRITTHTTTPAELLLGRKPRTHLDLIRPESSGSTPQLAKAPSKAVQMRVAQSQHRQKEGHERRAKQRNFTVGQSVYKHPNYLEMFHLFQEADCAGDDGKSESETASVITSPGTSLSGQTTLEYMLDSRSTNIFKWLEWIVMGELELIFCEKDLTRSNTKLKPISVKTLKKYMFKLVEAVEKKVSVKVSTAPSYALVFDGWSENSTHFIGLFVVHPGKEYAADPEIHLLAFAPLLDETNFTAENHVNFIKSTLEWYSLSLELLFCLIGDNSSTNKATADLLGVPVLGCRSHHFNLAVEAYISEFLAAELELIGKLMPKLSTLKQSGRLRLMTTLRPVKQNVTRWIGVPDMFQRFERLLPNIDEADSEIMDLVPTPAQKPLQHHDMTMKESNVLFRSIIDSYPEFAFNHYLGHDADIIHSKDLETAVIKIQANKESTLSIQEKRAVEQLLLPAASHAESGETVVDEDAQLSFADRALKRQRVEEKKECSKYINTRFLLPTSCEVERLFSMAKRVFCPLRRSFQPRTLEALLFLNQNRSLWNLARTALVVNEKESEKENEEEEEYEVDWSYTKSTACGPSGLRVQHLLDATEVPMQSSICSSLRSIVNLMATGSVSNVVSKFLVGGNLAALTKDKPGSPPDIRPIAGGETLRRLVGKCLCQITKGKPSDYFSPHQFGVACPSGAEKIVHVLSAIASDPICFDLNLFHAWYIDDGVIAGSKQAVVQALSIIQDLGPPLGLVINSSKCELYGDCDLQPFPSEMKKCNAFNSEILGAPIGDTIFCAKFIAEKRAGASKLLALLKEVGSLDSQVALIALIAGFLQLMLINCLGSECDKNLQLFVTSPLTPITLHEASVTSGSTAQVAENRKHVSNDAKCSSLVVERIAKAARVLKAIKAVSTVTQEGEWWLGLDTSQGSQCALCPGIALDPLGHHAITYVLAEICHRAHLGVQVEAGNDLTADHSHTRPADLLLTNWATGKTAAFDISVTSPLNTLNLLEAGVSAGSAVQATETRKHMANDAKCNELGWLCVPQVAETYGAWGNEAMEAFSQLASRLATHTCRLKSPVTFELYSRLNLHLVRANATAILTRCIQS